MNRQDDSLLPPPRSFRHLVRGRYDGSDDGTRRFVDALAVLGLHASVADVAAMAGLADPVGAIDEATANGSAAGAPGRRSMVGGVHPSAGARRGL